MVAEFLDQIKALIGNLESLLGDDEKTNIIEQGESYTLDHYLKFSTTLSKSF